MKIALGLIGAILGGVASQSFFGALIGLGVGLMFAIVFLDKRPPPESARPAAMPVETRIARLEKEVALLRDEVKRLSQAQPGEDTAMQAPAPAPEAAARNDDTAPARLDVPATPIREPWPEPVETDKIAMSPGEPAPAPQVAAVADEGAAAPPFAAQPTPPRLASEPQPSLRQRLPPVLSKLIFGGNTIVKVGVMILFLGLAFLLRYAAERVTVPVEFRYAGVALCGAVLLALGWRLRDRKDATGGSGYGLILQGAGIGVFYLTTLAALKHNQLLPPELAFVFLFAVTILSAVLAVAQNAPWLAIVAAAEGFAAPVLVSTGSGNHIALFSYLAVLDVGIALVAWFRAWRMLNVIGAFGTFTLAAAWADKHYQDALYPSTQAFLLLFFVLFTGVGVLFATRALAQGQEPDARDPLAQRAAQALAQVGRVDSALVFGVPLASFGLQYLLVKGTEFGPAWAALGFSLFHLLLGALLMRGSARRYALLGEAYVIVSVIFGTLAVALALEGAWTGATWAIEAAGMYWLGLRQQRTYSRAFALIVLAGAALRVASSLDTNFTPGAPLLIGSVLSVMILSVGALAMFSMSRRLTSPPPWEAVGRAGQLWIGVASLAAVAWMLLMPIWASAATAVLAFACALLNARAAMPDLQPASGTLHAGALIGFASTLHQFQHQAMLSNGWQGVAAALVVGSSLLGTAWLSLQATLRTADAQHAAPQWSLSSSVGLLAGMAVVSLSLLFVMPADRAALAWPWMGVAALWLSLRIAHSAPAVAWAVLQWSAGFALLVFGAPLWADDSVHLTLWAPLMLTLAGLLAGDMLQRAARSPTSPQWLRGPAAQWGVVLWSLAWWTQVLLPDAWRHLRHTNSQWPLVLPAMLSAWLTLSSVLFAGIACWRNWRVLGQTTWATPAGWAITALMGIGTVGFAPHEHFGWIVWPLALAWHLALLRLQPRWGTHAALTPLHVGGFWLFLLLAAREMQWWSNSWGDAGSAWPALGWVVVPALALALVSYPTAQRRWPLVDFNRAYLVIGCVPVAVYLLLWLWVSNAESGDANPLPYVPLLNPLEVGHGLVLLALLAWQRALPATKQAAVPRPLFLSVLGATALALYTGMVLRTCHHWAGIGWSEDALYESMLAQAALSVAWTIVGVALMMVGHRSMRRSVWVIGAALLGAVVLKLFLVELADRGGLYRIVSFIVVGILLLVVGYFAPVPPSPREPPPARETS